eukprot:134091-Pyramimonas_sp.AAC.1
MARLALFQICRVFGQLYSVASVPVSPGQPGGICDGRTARNSTVIPEVKRKGVRVTSLTVLLSGLRGLAAAGVEAAGADARGLEGAGGEVELLSDIAGRRRGG